MTDLATWRDEALALGVQARAKAVEIKDAADAFIAASLQADTEMDALVSGDPEVVANRFERRQAFEDKGVDLAYVQSPAFGAIADEISARYMFMCQAIE